MRSLRTGSAPTNRRGARRRFGRPMPRYDMMEEPERDEKKAGSRAVSFLLLGGITVTMTAWIVFLGWAAWSLLGDG